MAEIRVVDASLVEDTVARLLLRANLHLPSDIAAVADAAEQCDGCPLARDVMARLRENREAAERIEIPICQDTGMAIVFIDVGEEVHISGNLNDAVNRATARAYVDGYMRLSVVSDPLYARKNTNNNTPAIIHLRIVPGDRITVNVMPKGFGSENMSALRMFTPSATEDDVVRFVLDTVSAAGSNPCPPIIVGVGIGGDFEYSALLAKRALLRPLDQRNGSQSYAALESRLLSEINALGIGPQGFGGDTTALGVAVEFAPTHIAGLPVAVNISCHVTRHATAII